MHVIISVAFALGLIVGILSLIKKPKKPIVFEEETIKIEI